MTYFTWYKDTFLSLLYQRDDSLLDLWKEIFLIGLPPLFAKRVKNCLQNQYNEMIPYTTFTFGKLINVAVTEGLPLLNDLNLKNQLKK